MIDVAKFWLLSKTVLINTGVLAISLLAFLQGSELISGNPHTVACIGMAIGITNIVVRFLTVVPVRLLPE